MHHSKEILIMRYCDYSIFQNGGCILDFRNCKILLADSPKGPDISQCQISLKSINPLWRYCHFLFLKVADFGNCRILLNGEVWRAQTHHHNHFFCGDTVIF